jgi:hypothetical protein
VKEKIEIVRKHLGRMKNEEDSNCLFYDYWKASGPEEALSEGKAVSL